MIDMHLHTYYSDGTLSPTDLVKRAADRGVMTIAVTDHDGFNGIEEAIKAGEVYGVKVIPGVELSTIMSGSELELGFVQQYDVADFAINTHILGYEIDIYDEDLNQAVDKIRKERAERNNKMLSAFNRLGMDINEEDLVNRKEQDYVGKPNFVLALLKKGYIKTTKEAGKPGEYLGHPLIRRIHREKIHVKKAIELIKGAGGYAVLAHPMKVKLPVSSEEDKFQLLNPLLDKLMDWGLSGMECYYGTHTEEQTERLLQMAQSRGMIVTAGSDFHGPEFGSEIDIGVTGKKND